MHDWVGQFAHRHGLAGEQRFVHIDLTAHQLRIGGNAVAFMQHQQVAHHHVAPGDALFAAVADHQCTRRGEITQRFERALRLALLRQRDADHHEYKAEQKQRLALIAQEQVDAARGQQHEEHRLAQHAKHNGPGRLGRGAGQQVLPIARQTCRGFDGAQTRWHRVGPILPGDRSGFIGCHINPSICAAAGRRARRPTPRPRPRSMPAPLPARCGSTTWRCSRR